MPIHPTHSSEYEAWETPLWLFNWLDETFKFQLDAAASAENALCDFYYDETENGLLQPWENSTFCNPPRCNRKGMRAEDWVNKGYEEAKLGKLSVFLLRCSTETEVFLRFYEHGQVIFLTPRVPYYKNGVLGTQPGWPSFIGIFWPNLSMPWPCNQNVKSWLQNVDWNPDLIWHSPYNLPLMVDWKEARLEEIYG